MRWHGNDDEFIHWCLENDDPDALREALDSVPAEKREVIKIALAADEHMFGHFLPLANVDEEVEALEIRDDPDAREKLLRVFREWSKSVG